jgi:hypothetical protein
LVSSRIRSWTDFWKPSASAASPAASPSSFSFACSCRVSSLSSLALAAAKSSAERKPASAEALNSVLGAARDDFA